VAKKCGGNNCSAMALQKSPNPGYTGAASAQKSCDQGTSIHFTGPNLIYEAGNCRK